MCVCVCFNSVKTFIPPAAISPAAGDTDSLSCLSSQEGESHHSGCLHQFYDIDLLIDLGHGPGLQETRMNAQEGKDELP